MRRLLKYQSQANTGKTISGTRHIRHSLDNAIAKKTQIGSPQTTRDNIPAGFLRHYPAFRNGLLNISELARVCDLSRTTVYKYIWIVGRVVKAGAEAPGPA